jgi:hypothetical protein
MRIEGHDDRRRRASSRHTTEAFEHLLMPAVHAVEIAEGQHRLRPARRALIVGEVDNVHGETITAERAENSHVHHEDTKITQDVHNSDRRSRLLAEGASASLAEARG